MTKVTYRRVVPMFWTDPDVKNTLSLEEKALLLYLFTNEHAHPCGVYRLRLLFITDELGLEPARAVEELRTTLAPFATYDETTEEVFVHAMAEHQIGELHGKDKRIQWVQKQVASIRSDHLRAAFWGRYRDWNLDPDALDVPANVENSSPSGDGSTTRKTKGHDKGHAKGLHKGHTKPLPKPAAATAAASAADLPSSHPPGSGSRARRAFDQPQPSADPPAREVGEDGEATARDEPPGDPVARWEPLARENLRRIRGRTDDQDVEILGQRVGMGIEINRYRRLAKSLREGPEIVAKAIRHLPAVTGLDAPVSLARWLASDGSAVLQQCIHRALEEAPSGDDPEVQKLARKKAMPPPTSGDAEEFERRRREEKAKLEAMRRAQHLADETEDDEHADAAPGAA